MIDFDIYEDSDAQKPRRRRRSSKKRVSFGHREFLDAKENLVNVEQITPLKQPTPPARRASRAVLAHIGGAKAKLFSAVTPAARRRRRQEKRDAAAAQKASIESKAPSCARSSVSTTTPVRRPTSLTIFVCLVHRFGSARACQSYLNNLAHCPVFEPLGVRRLAALRDVCRLRCVRRSNSFLQRCSH